MEGLKLFKLEGIEVVSGVLSLVREGEGRGGSGREGGASKLLPSIFNLPHLLHVTT